MSYDLGDVVTVGVTIYDALSAPANAGAVVATITLPDGTTTTPTVSNTTTGVYTIAYTPTLVGRHGIRWVATGANAAAHTDVFTVNDPSLLPVVSLAELKTHLNIAATTSDEELRDTLDAATAAAEEYCNRALTRRAVTETYDGGQTSLRLRSCAALSVTTVVEGGATLATDDYRLNFGVTLDRKSGSLASYWSPGLDNVSVTYVIGVEGRQLSAARRGVLGIAKHMWDTQRGAMTIGPRSDDQWLPGMGYSIPNRAAQLLDPIRLVASA